METHREWKLAEEGLEDETWKIKTFDNFQVCEKPNFRKLNFRMNSFLFFQALFLFLSVPPQYQCGQIRQFLKFSKALELTKLTRGTFGCEAYFKIHQMKTFKKHIREFENV